MNKNKNFLDQLDGGWGDLIADTYREENKLNTIFYGSYYGKTFSYNVNNMFRRELFKLPIDIITVYNYVGGQIIIPRELIDPALCTGPINDLNEIIIEIRFCGIDIDMLYEYGRLSEEEFETGKVEKDHSDIIINIKYKFADNSKTAYFETYSHDIESNKATNYTIETALGGPVLLYADLELMKYFVEKSAELYINIPRRLLPISKETKNRMYNLISEVNQQNSELAKK